MITAILKYILYALGIILVYEVLRGLLLTRIRNRLYRSVKEYLTEHHIRLDRYKFMHKVVVKQELMNDPEIHSGIIEHAAGKGVKIREVQDQVEDYIEEIVPFFNLLSYYKIGFWVANFFLNLIYEVVIDRENAAKLKKIPPDSVVVFVMNHRSNIDYILVAFMLAQQISLSYAVGEWARVWPLEYIFKSFGAYFIRRKYREQLYHLVLEKYVQLISLQGVTQGIFLEGGLTRNGRFRQPKVGILDYIMKIRKNPQFAKDLVFVPAAINYDWVLEDRTLLQELKSGKEKSGFRDHIHSLARVLVRGPALLFANTLRYFSGRLKQHGYASVSFGDPLFLSDFLAQQKRDIFAMERKERLGHVQEFADMLMERIGRVIPVTPVCITSLAILQMENQNFSREDLIRSVAAIRMTLRGAGCRMVLGRAFEQSSQILSHLADERDSRKKELINFEEEFMDYEQSKETVDVALDLMKRRKILIIRKDQIGVNKKMTPLLEYYSNSLLHFTR
ncbi:MAG: 1-acyl-sn-glycerol-3-phosphate acyltransferase [Spirochaetes bacterium]|nr:1-acyl-sn-glycerol-3-phosphate acyltransferase [Spirochaetota bacterium]